MIVHVQVMCTFMYMSRCAAIQAGLIKNGDYQKYKAVHITGHEISVLCPKGIVKKPEDIEFVINRIGQLQIRDRVDHEPQDEVGAQPVPQ